jgi:hypothetical protein
MKRWIIIAVLLFLVFWGVSPAQADRFYFGLWIGPPVICAPPPVYYYYLDHRHYRDYPPYRFYDYNRYYYPYCDRKWVPGFWQLTPYGWRWIPGYWR